MPTYDGKLERSEELAEGTMAFHFKKPANFSFKPGQAIDLILVDPHNPALEIGRHAFSLVSAPFENELVVATRMRGSVYKRALQSLPVGATAGIDGPFGSLTLHKDAARAAVFIAGGIGITPFMSMLRQAAHERAPHRLVLMYSNRRPEDAAFLDELHALLRSNPNFRLLATMTEMAQSTHAWDGATGFIDEAMVRRAVADLERPVFYVAGPPAMVEAMKGVLSRSGIDDDDIRSEDFFGY